MRRNQNPFLFAFALLAVVYVTIANSSQVPEIEALAAPLKGGLPCPRNSDASWFVRNKTERDEACIERWGEAAPRRWYVGRAVRYNGDEGPYYVFEGWIPLPDENCTSTDLDESGAFTSNTLLYMPKLARLFSSFEPKDQTCDTSPCKPVSTTDVAAFNQQAMAVR